MNDKPAMTMSEIRDALGHTTPGLPADDVTINADYAPSLVFISRDGVKTAVALVDRVAPDDSRDRAICRALLLHALTLLDAAEVGERLALGLPATPAP